MAETMESGTIVTIICDGGWKYLSSGAWTDDLDVEWAGHPNYYFRISKFSIPWLRHPWVPRTQFLHEIGRLPDDRISHN